MRTIRGLGLALLAAGAGMAQGFQVQGTELMDANGQPFVMKGVNVPLAWFASNVNGNLASILAKTGSNAFRIVVETRTPDAQWQAAVNACIANQVVPMVELHDVTGGTDAVRLADMARHWAGRRAFLSQPSVARHVLVNIANEWGDWNMANTAAGRAKWRDAYREAITILRDAGIRSPLVIDAPDWGQDLRDGSTLRAHALELQAHDPLHNLLFSVHMYCEWGAGGGSRITTGLPSIQAAGIPIIVGEFGYQHSDGNGGVCDIDESSILSTAEAHGIGWLAWSWKGNGGDVTYLDLSRDWAGNDLSPWGSTVVNGPRGTRTARKSTSFTGVSSVAWREGRVGPGGVSSAREGSRWKPTRKSPGVDGRWSLDRRARVVYALPD